MIKQYLNIVKKLLDFHLPLLGTFWVLYYIYIRIISSYITYESRGTIFNNKILYIGLTISFICLHLFIIKTIIEFYFGFENPKKYPFITNIVDTLYWNPLLYIYEVVAYKIPYSGVTFLWITKYINKYKIESIFLFCAIVFDYIPRLLIAVSFFLDVTIYHNMFHFLSVLNYILIPILYKIFLKLYLDFALRNYQKFDKYIRVTQTSDGNYKFSPVDDYVLDPNLCEGWISLRDVEVIATMFQQVCNAFSTPIYLINSICYLIGWSYILLFTHLGL